MLVEEFQVSGSVGIGFEGRSCEDGVGEGAPDERSCQRVAERGEGGGEFWEGAIVVAIELFVTGEKVLVGHQVCTRFEEEVKVRRVEFWI